MEKSKIWVLVALMLALFFFGGMDAKAASAPIKSYTPITKSSAQANTFVYHFYHSADGIAVSETGEYITFGGGTAVIDLDLSLGRGSFNLNDFGVDAQMYEAFTVNIKCDNEAELTYVDFENGLNIFEQKVISAIPYIIIGGEKHYLVDEHSYQFGVDGVTASISFSLGLELEMLVSYDATSVSDTVMATNFAKSTLTVTRNPFEIYLYGLNDVSSGERYIADTVNTQGNAITNALTEFKERIAGHIDNIDIYVSGINDRLGNIFNKLETFRSESNTHLNTITSKITDVYNAILRGYDSTKADDTNTTLSGSLDSWTAAEGTTMSDAKIEVSSYDISSAFNFAPALVSSLSLITTFTNSFFVASGDFSSALIVMVALVFVSVIVGLVRFVRS